MLAPKDPASSGGGSGIRTHVTVSRKHAFQACAFSHSAPPPLRRREGARKLYLKTRAKGALVRLQPLGHPSTATPRQRAHSAAARRAHYSPRDWSDKALRQSPIRHRPRGLKPLQSGRADHIVSLKWPIRSTTTWCALILATRD